MKVKVLSLLLLISILSSGVEVFAAESYTASTVVTIGVEPEPDVIMIDKWGGVDVVIEGLKPIEGLEAVQYIEPGITGDSKTDYIKQQKAMAVRYLKKAIASR